MGCWCGLRVAFAVGSVFVFLQIAFWDQVSLGFNLYPLQDPKHDPFGSSFPLPWSKTVEEQEVERQHAEEKRQVERKRRIFDTCAAMGNESVHFPGKSQTFKQIPQDQLDHLIVDDTHQIIYCNVPKIASSNWKRVMVVLAGSLVSPLSGRPYTDPESIPRARVHDASLLHTFAGYGKGSETRKSMELRLQNYTKFLFVRDPFVRIISAFRNKFGSVNHPFYQRHGIIMLRRYANMSGRVPATSAEAFADGTNPSFLHFIKYLLDPHTENGVDFDEHWRQVYRLCHPCQIQYDFIGNLETVNTDSEQLLKLLGLDHLFQLPSGQQKLTDDSWLSDWFSLIPVAMRKELYKLFEPDFELFGYPKPNSLLLP